MLKLLTAISPIAVLLIGALPSLALGWGAREAKFAWLDRPAIVREASAAADAACAIRTMDAANRAEQAERARQHAANADARRLYEEALDASQRAALAAQSVFEQEVQAYEHQLAAEGRSCPLSDADVVRLQQLGATGAD